MTTVVAFLRAVNVGGRGKLKMDVLRDIAADLDWCDPATVLQSGNLIADVSSADASGCAAALQSALAKQQGLSTSVIVLSAAELKAAIDAVPFDIEDGRNLSHVLLHILEAEPESAAFQALRSGYDGPESMDLKGRVLYIFYAEGIGRSKLTTARIDRALGVVGTARNWKTLMKIRSLIDQRCKPD